MTSSAVNTLACLVLWIIRCGGFEHRCASGQTTHGLERAISPKVGGRPMILMLQNQTAWERKDDLNSFSTKLELRGGREDEDRFERKRNFERLNDPYDSYGRGGRREFREPDSRNGRFTHGRSGTYQHVDCNDHYIRLRTPFDQRVRQVQHSVADWRPEVMAQRMQEAAIATREVRVENDVHHVVVSWVEIEKAVEATINDGLMNSASRCCAVIEILVKQGLVQLSQIVLKQAERLGIKLGPSPYLSICRAWCLLGWPQRAEDLLRSGVQTSKVMPSTQMLMHILSASAKNGMLTTTHKVLQSIQNFASASLSGRPDEARMILDDAFAQYALCLARVGMITGACSIIVNNITAPIGKYRYKPEVQTRISEAVGSVIAAAAQSGMYSAAEATLAAAFSIRGSNASSSEHALLATLEIFSAHCAHGLIDVKVFEKICDDEFVTKSIVGKAYAALVNGYLLAGRMTEAHIVLNEAYDSDDLRHNPELCALEIRLLANNGDLVSAQKRFETLRRYGVEIAPALVALIQAYCAAGMVEQAEMVISRMRCEGISPSLKTCVHVAVAYHEIDPDICSELLDAITSEARPSSSNYGELLHACSLIGDYARAIKIRGDMRHAGILLDTRGYAALIGLILDKIGSKEANALLQVMSKSGVDLSLLSLKSLLKLRFLDGGDPEEYWHNALKSGINASPAAWHAKTCFIVECLQARVAGAMQNWSRHLHVDLPCSSILNDKRIYETMLQRMSLEGNVSGAMHTWQSMVQNGITPTSRAYSFLIMAHTRGSLPMNVINILEEAQENQIVLDAKCRGAAVLALCLAYEMLLNGTIGLDEVKEGGYSDEDGELTSEGQSVGVGCQSHGLKFDIADPHFLQTSGISHGNASGFRGDVSLQEDEVGHTEQSMIFASVCEEYQNILWSGGIPAREVTDAVNTLLLQRSEFELCDVMSQTLRSLKDRRAMFISTEGSLKVNLRMGKARANVTSVDITEASDWRLSDTIDG